jgi:hypothetical protein
MTSWWQRPRSRLTVTLVTVGLAWGALVFLRTTGMAPQPLFPSRVAALAAQARSMTPSHDALRELDRLRTVEAEASEAAREALVQYRATEGPAGPRKAAVLWGDLLDQRLAERQAATRRRQDFETRLRGIASAPR